jgi:hypothetical protein
MNKLWRARNPGYTLLVGLVLLVLVILLVLVLRIVLLVLPMRLILPMLLGASGVEFIIPQTVLALWGSYLLCR